jgi:sterol desaturase/sphingolipid hydroxylase (fatty acid hydroxylase superfamily)
MSTTNYSFITYFLSYWIIGLFFALLDFYWPKYHYESYKKYKLQPIDLSVLYQQYKDCSVIVLRNQLLIQLPLLLIFDKYYEEIELTISIVWNILCTYLLINVIFIIVHVLLHKYAYNIHKIHHHYKNPFAISAEHNSLIEEFISYSYTYLIFYLFPLPYWLMLCGIVIMNVIDLIPHSGYYIDNSVLRHDLHHRLFNVNLTPFPFVDKLLGTHFLILSNET